VRTIYEEGRTPAGYRVIPAQQDPIGMLPLAQRKVWDGAHLTLDAAAIAPAPEFAPPGRNFALGLIMAAGAAAFLHLTGGILGPGAPVAAGLGLGAVVQLGLGARRTRNRAAIEEGRPAAMRYWEPAWFCHDCLAVFYPEGNEPARIPRGTVMTADEFRGEVWRAGGYGHRLKPLLTPAEHDPEDPLNPLAPDPDL
jgi:hypothetical protein